MNAPVITLKNVKYAEFASQETSCFSATVYVDGKKFCTAENEGHGGPDLYSPISGPQNAFYAEGGPYRTLEARIKATIPAREFHGRMLESSLEQLVGEALEDHLLGKELKAKMRSKVLVLEGTDVMAYGWKGVRKIEDRHLAMIRTKLPEAKVLNDLPFAEAVALYREHAV